MNCVPFEEGEGTLHPGGCAGAMNGAPTQMIGAKRRGLVGVWELLWV